MVTIEEQVIETMHHSQDLETGNVANAKMNFAKRNECFKIPKRVGGPKRKGHYGKLLETPHHYTQQIYGRSRRDEMKVQKAITHDAIEAEENGELEDALKHAQLAVKDPEHLMFGRMIVCLLAPDGKISRY